MQSSPAWKSDYTFSPLEGPAAQGEASDFPADTSTASSPNLETLVERFSEPLSGGFGAAAATTEPVPVAAPARPEGNGRTQAPATARLPAPAPKEFGLPARGLIAGLAGLALVPMSFAFVLWWQGPGQSPQEPSASAELAIEGAPAQPAKSAPAFEVALSSPDRIGAKTGETIAFPIVIDATAALPARSLVAVSALPQGAAFSQGRPYGDNGWSLRPDEIGDLQLQLPAQSSTADLRLQLVAGDGSILARSETQVSITPASAEVAAAGASESTPPEQMAQAEQTGADARLAPAPPRKPEASATTEPDVKVNTVKTVAVAPPDEKKPYDGAYALGAPADAPQATGEWMETKTWVDMHARAEQKSETVKVAKAGMKLRVTGRDKNWVQVRDPESGTTGWIYDRFLKPAE